MIVRRANRTQVLSKSPAGTSDICVVRDIVMLLFDLGGRVMCRRFVCMVAVAVMMGLVSEASADLVGWWKLDEGDGTTVADSAGPSNGTITGAMWVDDAVRGWVLSFGGSDYVDLDLSGGSSFATITDGTTVAFWMHGYDDLGGSGLSNVTFHARVEGVSEIYLQHPHKSDKTYWYAPGAEYVRVDLPEDQVEGIWSHWAFTKDATTGDMKIYQNGVEIATAGGKTALLNGSGITAARIGMHVGGIFGFHGMLSDVRLYDRALSQSEVMAVVPEPATICLLGLGGLVLLRKKR